MAINMKVQCTPRHRHHMEPSEKMGSQEEQPLNNKEKPKKKTLKEKIAEIKAFITLEPVLLCFDIPGMLIRLATQNLNIDKACRVNMQYGTKVCDALIVREGNKYQKEELAVQQLIAGMEIWKNLLMTVLPSFLILFVGAWSDRTGKRKICILVPIIGYILVCLSNMLNVYFFYELPVQVNMFFEGFFRVISGGWMTMFMSIFAYIGDISSEGSRTVRLGIANLCLTAGEHTGNILSGILLKHAGYYGVYMISCSLYLFCIFYAYVYIKDFERPATENPEQNESSNVRGFLKSFFDIKHVKDTLTVAFKKGPNKRRTRSILVLVSILFVYGPAHGEKAVRYLFTRYRFNWDALKYSFYSTFVIFIHLIGTLISISLFSHRLKWHDSVLGIVSSVSKVAGCLYTGFARNSMDMYIAVVVETFNATSLVALRSISSKLVTSDELGKMVAIFNLMEVITLMIFDPTYSWIYMVTIKIDAGIVYYVSTMLTILPLLFFSWFYMQYKKDTAKSKKGEGRGQNVTELQAMEEAHTLIVKKHVNHEAIPVE